MSLLLARARTPLARALALTRTARSRTIHRPSPRLGPKTLHVRIPIIPLAAGAAYTTMAPVPAQQQQQQADAMMAEFKVTEPKSGGEKSGKMHSQVVIIGSGPAGHT